MTPPTIHPHAGLRSTVVIIGNTNAGKSSLLNQIIGEEVAIVSATRGTTTDAVLKTYELLPAGPVSFYDTAGLDDTTSLGSLRIKATEALLPRADLILFVIGKEEHPEEIETRLQTLQSKSIPFIPVFNYADERPLTAKEQALSDKYAGLSVSAKTGHNIKALKARLATKLLQKTTPKKLLAGLIHQGDTVLLVTPIDTAAAQGRLIMPQVQTLREILDTNAIAITCQTSELPTALNALKTPPALVITDSQAIKEVSSIVPPAIKLTTFSMLLAKNKGDFKTMLSGAHALSELKDGDKVLIAEGCSHRQTCDDIGRVKLPHLIKSYTGKQLQFEFTAGHDFPEDLSDYALVVHCGGCILPTNELQHRLNLCKEHNIKITNYGMVISATQNVLTRTSQPLL